MGSGNRLQRMQDASEYPNAVVRELLVLTCTRDASVKIASEERGHDLQSIGAKPLMNVLGEDLSRVGEVVTAAKRENPDRFRENATRLWSGHNQIARLIEKCETQGVDWGNRLCNHIKSRPCVSFDPEFKCIWHDSLEQSREIILDSTSNGDLDFVDHLSGVARQMIHNKKSEQSLQDLFVWGAHIGPIKRDHLDYAGWANWRIERAADHVKSFFED